MDPRSVTMPELPLAEAVRLMERHADSPLALRGFREVFLAARRELERQEKEKPERASLSELEDSLRKTISHLGHDYGEPCFRCLRALEAADILKEVREFKATWDNHMGTTVPEHFNFNRGYQIVQLFVDKLQ